MRFDDAMGDLACGITSQGIGIFLKLATVPLYAVAFRRLSIVSWAEGSPWPWLIGIVGYDLCYYWWHRQSHERNALWAVHVVHHQSDDFNLAVALRQDWFGPLTSAVFGLPLALLGVPPEVYLASVSINLLYQFWIHTELIGRLGAFERIFNSPSHHRVHHGTNPQYLDKNYGGILIVWDRIFGTFEDEVERPAYGITTQFRSFDAVHANVAYWREIVALARQRPTCLSGLAVLVEPPGHDPNAGRVVHGAFDPERPKFRATKLSAASHVYLFVSFLGSVVLLLWMLKNEASLPLTRLALGAAVLVCLSVGWSALLEARGRTLAWSLGGTGLFAALLAWH